MDNKQLSNSPYPALLSNSIVKEETILDDLEDIWKEDVKEIENEVIVEESSSVKVDSESFEDEYSEPSDSNESLLVALEKTDETYSDESSSTTTVESEKKKKPERKKSPGKEVGSEKNVDSRKKRSVKCDRCKRIFVGTKGLKEHDCKFFQCNVCNKEFYKKQNMVRHLNVHNAKGRPFECHVCKIRFALNDQLARHLIRHTELVPPARREPLECPFCQRTFANTFSLSSHLRTHDTRGEKLTYPCRKCSKVFPKLANLSRHMKIHDRKYRCKICLMRFSLNTRLISHIEQCHKDDANIGTKCNQCGKVMKFQKNLQRHLKLHEKSNMLGELPSTDRSETSQTILAQIRKPYVCKACNSGFSDLESLTQHIQIHIEANKKTS